MNIQFDKEADALYIQFQQGHVKRTLKIKEGILVDIDAKGRLFGIEILDATSRIPMRSLNKVHLSTSAS